MSGSSLRILTWGIRILLLVIAFWWPAVIRDPIYTPRQARLSGQALQLPSPSHAQPEDASALAIFWNWEHRSFVSTRWIVGPWRGVRSREGRTQTFIVLVLLWAMSGIWLARKEPPS